MLTFLSITQGALLLAQMPSPQSPPLPSAAAVVPVQAQPAAAAVPAGQPVMMMVIPAIAQTPAPQPIAVQVVPATYQYVAIPATVAAPASSPAMLAGELHEPGPIHRWLGQVGEKIARLKDPRISLRVQPQPQPAGPTAVQVIQVQAQPQPQPQPPAKNSAGLVEPASALPSKQMPR